MIRSYQLVKKGPNKFTQILNPITKIVNNLVILPNLILAVVAFLKKIPLIEKNVN